MFGVGRLSRVTGWSLVRLGRWPEEKREEEEEDDNHDTVFSLVFEDQKESIHAVPC